MHPVRRDGDPRRVLRLRGGGNVLPTGRAERIVEGATGMEGDGNDAHKDAGEDADVAPGKVRRKMAVGEGRSMMHWMNMRPKINRQRWVTMDEVRKHNSSSDAWTVFRGKVYDCTAFFDYHPGGAAMMQAVAGKDGTKLFDKYHSWVNVDFIMEKCLVGFLKDGDNGLDVEVEGDQEVSDDEQEDSEVERNTRMNSGASHAHDGVEGMGGCRSRETALDEMD